jgi:four helix bundle protein
MPNSNLNNLRIYQLAETLADAIWEIVNRWNNFEKEVLGKQLIRSADSIGANISEGYGRGTMVDKKRFIIIARGSLYETKHFLRRTFKRNLIDSSKIESLQKILNELTPKVNSYINYLEKHETKKFNIKKL